MLTMKTNAGEAVGTVLLDGHSVGPAQNRALLEWIKSCPVPGAVRLNIGGKKRLPGHLFGGSISAGEPCVIELFGSAPSARAVN